MADTTKKKAPAKPRKTAAKTNGASAEVMPQTEAPAIAAAAEPKPKKTAKTNGAAGNGAAAESKPTGQLSHEEVARLAHQFWIQRGHQHGRHEEDWHRAEQELRKRAS